MSWWIILRLIVVWYVVVQLVTLAALPLTLRVLRSLPDRGYSLAKVSGVLLVGVVYWLGFSYGLVRNERGGVWVALVAVAVTSWALGWSEFVTWWRNLRSDGRLTALVTADLVFLVAFAGWVVVRAYDPNVDHTEQPMDLMFMNSLWGSANFPPQDAWLAGYGISYYYLGYWLLTTMARLANTPPSIAYNVGQALWYGFLWLGCFGIVLNLLAWRFGRDDENSAPQSLIERIPPISLVGGVVGGFTVAFVGNLMVILEWLYAQGFNISTLAKWIDVHEFPENASQTGMWFIDNGWWWWRSSRVIEDLDLTGSYRDVIDEFPMFSYLLGDNHPHVMAMPIVTLVIALALNLLFLWARHSNVDDAPQSGGWRGWLPVDGVDSAIILVALGSLVFLNTWDFPPYWLLLVAIVFLATGGGWTRAIGVGAFLLVGSILLYLPYFLTAQSQAGGILPNAFNPTRFPQFLIMFGGLLPAVIGVALLGWRTMAPRRSTAGWVVLVILGVPIAFLMFIAILGTTSWAQSQGMGMNLPTLDVSYGEVVAQRWLSEPWTLLFVGLLLSVVVSCIVVLVKRPLKGWAASADLVFVLLVAAIGLALIYAPEFVFLRDNFGSRMNTVFKFYYQGWLLLGLATAYLITIAIRHIPKQIGVVELLGVLSLMLLIGCALFPVAGVYAKTNGFTRGIITLDATDYVAQRDPDVMAAVEWVRLNTTPDELVLEGRGDSYWASHNRISALTGRGTLMGWEGHERQWRGDAYNEMADGRLQAIEQIYRTASPEELSDLLEKWGVDYVYVGPIEIEKYGITPFRVEELSEGMDTVFERGQTRIFRRREG